VLTHQKDLQAQFNTIPDNTQGLRRQAVGQCGAVVRQKGLGGKKVLTPKNKSEMTLPLRKWLPIVRIVRSFVSPTQLNQDWLLCEQERQTNARLFRFHYANGQSGLIMLKLIDAKSFAISSDTNGLKGNALRKHQSVWKALYDQIKNYLGPSRYAGLRFEEQITEKTPLSTTLERIQRNEEMSGTIWNPQPTKRYQIRAPKRPADLNRWKVTWRYVRDLHKRGTKNSKILDFLEQKRKEEGYLWVPSEYTLAQIVRAGDEGQLED
jgi:hypothetical protein